MIFLPWAAQRSLVAMKYTDTMAPTSRFFRNISVLTTPPDTAIISICVRVSTSSFSQVVAVS